MIKTRPGEIVAKATAAVVLTLCTTAAFAAATWNFNNTTVGTPDGCQVQNSGYGQQTTNANNFGNTYKCQATTGTGPTLTVSAWGQASTAGFQTAFVSKQGDSGFGLASQTETLTVSAPNHAMDNYGSNGTPDMFLLNFSSAVALDKVALGWSQSDADFTLMAYKGSATTAADIVQGKTANNLTAGAGWALIENSGDADAQNAVGYSGSGTDITRTVNVNAPAVTSSWWLISAYHSGYGGGSLDALPDYMKLLSVASKDVAPGAPPPGVPEPGTLALVGLALLGFVRSRHLKPTTTH